MNILCSEWGGIQSIKQNHYDAIDGLRALSCLGIIVMHIQANTEYKLGGMFIFDKFIPSLTTLVYLFLMISGFCMCAGYLEKFQRGTIDIEVFYRKRYMKILPFFSVLLCIALVMEHNMSTVYEISVEAFMLHGLLPNNAVSVIGVCWTLGVIFLFYLLFPAFSVLMKSKKRAWFSLLISLWIVFVCNQYFFTDYFVTESFAPRHNFLYCLPLFIAGGLVYLYRNEIVRICELIGGAAFLICIIVSILWYLKPNGIKMISYVGSLLMFSLWLSYAIGSKSRILSSRPMQFLSSISMEMYLAQMVVFRVIEKLHLIYVFGDNAIGGWISFILAFVLTVLGLIVFIECYKYVVKVLKKWKGVQCGKV